MAIREQVSGPGSQSKRTDMNVSKQPTRYISGGTYGEGREMLQQQAGASMYQEPSTPVAPAVNRSKLMTSLMPSGKLTDKTNRPNEEITSGMNFGSGPGFESLNLPAAPPQPTLESEISKLIPGDNTGKLSAIFNEIF